MTTTRIVFIAWLAAWFACTAAVYVHVNAFGGIDDAFRGFAHVWHPYYFNVIYAVFGIPPALWMARHGVRRFGWRSDLGRTLVLVTAALCAWAVGNCIWFWYNTCSRWSVLGCERDRQVPLPSFADLAYSSWHVCMFLAMASLGRAFGLRRRDVTGAWWVLTGVIVLISWLSLPGIGLGWIVRDDYSLGQTVYSMGYVLAHVLVLSAVLLMAIRSTRMLGGVLFPPLAVLLAAAALMFVAEFAFFRTVANDTVRNGQPVEGLYAIVMLLVPISIYGFATVRMPRAASIDVVAGEGRPLNLLATSIVAAHSRLLGSVAYELAARVDGISVHPDKGHVTVDDADGVRALGGLLDAFEQVSGAFGAQVSRLAAAPVLREHAELPVPRALRGIAERVMS